MRRQLVCAAFFLAMTALRVSFEVAGASRAAAADKSSQSMSVPLSELSEAFVGTVKTVQPDGSSKSRRSK
jgi:hypothetical protein